ncbi:hypothetical protein GT350_26105 [Streptomyces sp. SID1034]|nr:glutaredoxin domain-containing protein [Streptomyces sp. SID1034]MYV93672.1 hypothetical protein [Streptomyces sp. SID1034]
MLVTIASGPSAPRTNYPHPGQGASGGSPTIGALSSARRHCGNRGRSVTQDQDGVVLYWRPMCTYCMKLRLRLLFTGLRFVKVNIWRDPDAAAFVRSVAGGNETVPTVTVAGRAMVNPSKRELFEAVRAHAPRSLPRGR